MMAITPSFLGEVHPDPPSKSDDKDSQVEPSCSTIDTTGILPLFQVLESFKQLDGRWTLSNIPDTESWEQFLKKSRSVETFTARSMPPPQPVFDPTTLVQLARMLKGEPLFPALCTLHIESFDSCLDYIALLASPALERVMVGYQPPPKPLSSKEPHSTRGRDVKDLTMSFITELAFYSKKLKVLHLENTVTKMPISLLENIRDFRGLQVLKLECFLLVMEGNFDPYLRCLESLSSLEILWLRVEESGADGRVQKGTPLEAGPAASEEFTIVRHSPQSLSHLDIVAPLHIVSKVVSVFGLTAMKTLSITPSKEPVMSSRMHRAFGVFDGFDELGTGSSAGAENLHAPERPRTPLREAFVPDAWQRLVSLKLSESTKFSLSQLKTIVESAPALRSLSLQLDAIHQKPPDDIIESAKDLLHHPLENLELLPLSSSLASAGKKKPKVTESFGLTLAMVSPWITIARYLNALFPVLQSLTAKEDEAAWTLIFRMMRLCQASLLDNKKRKGPSQGPT